MNTKRFLAALVAAFVVVLGSASGAFATFYAPAEMTLSVESPVQSGDSFSGSVTANRDCSWVITFDGPSSDGPVTTSSASGASAGFTFSTNVITADTVGSVTATCTYEKGIFGKKSVSQTFTTPTQMSRSADVTVLGSDNTVTPPVVDPPDDGTDPTDGNEGGFGGLPNTGGPSMWLALAGVSLTVLGAGAVLRSRRTA